MDTVIEQAQDFTDEELAELLEKNSEQQDQALFQKADAVRRIMVTKCLSGG